jgi:hypothetical protein
VDIARWVSTEQEGAAGADAEAAGSVLSSPWLAEAGSLSAVAEAAATGDAAADATAGGEFTASPCARLAQGLKANAKAATGAATLMHNFIVAFTFIYGRLIRSGCPALH